MKKLKFYSIFHLNLAFSSIPENQMSAVIVRCYWPLLRLAKKFKGAIAIEATGYTIEKIQELDPGWMVEFRKLLKDGSCEFIGSGYSQIVGPLVPAEVNAKNLSIGNEVYGKILGSVPKIAFINENAYSKGLVKIYLEAGYEAVVAEWDNAYQQHPEWDRSWKYFPQTIADDFGNRIRVIWNKSIAFQKFQRYVHDEIDLGEYSEYLESHIKAGAGGFFALYGSDAEIFDFRPGRYFTEAEMDKSEWQRVEDIYKMISRNKNSSFALPGQLLSVKPSKILNLESAQHPIVVKKQEKYNIVRWALTGRDDIGSNSACYGIFSKLKIIGEDGSLRRKKELYEKNNDMEFWKILCMLWGSDFRTHTEKNKYTGFKKELNRISSVLESIIGSPKPAITADDNLKNFHPVSAGRTVNIDTKSVNLTLNRRRGITIDRLIFKKISAEPLIKILPHGYYEKISFGADFYTGHTIIEAPFMPKITDLNPTEVGGLKKPDFSAIEGKVGMGWGSVKKTVTAYDKESRVDLKLDFSFDKYGATSFRTGIMTFNPEAFDLETLFFRCHNGGMNPETFHLKNVDLIDVRPVSLLVTAQNILGNTTGCLEIGDSKKSVLLKNNPADLAALPMIHYARLGGTYFLRVLYSAGEIDETSLLRDKAARPAQFAFNLSIIAKKA